MGQSGDIRESDIGKKVTIRLNDGDGYRDVVGHLTAINSLKNRHGQIVEFDPSKIHLWREIIATPRTATSGAPLSIRIYELERALNKTWSAKEEVEVGGWIFRADIGITKRANYALGWYRERNLNPTIHLIPTLHQELDEKLNKRGFRESMDALVMVKDHQGSEVDFEYEVSDSPSKEWLATQGDFEIAQLLQRSSAKYLSLKNGEKVIAVGRVANADDWAVLTRIWVAPEFRGQGLGRKILSALEVEANSSKVALQVASTNEVAINLYESFGYQIHHLYRFRAIPQRIDLLQAECC